MGKSSAPDLLLNEFLKFKVLETGKNSLTILQKIAWCKKSTQNDFVYGELGRVSVQNCIFIR